MRVRVALLIGMSITALRGQTTSSASVQVIALGDLNLGRTVGQVILKGDTLYPLSYLAPLLRNADLVIGNLESQITDQKGETQSKISNLIFCAPPAAASTLKAGAVSVVTTSNNHAWDYGKRGLVETLAFLDSAGIGHTGTNVLGDTVARPCIVTRKGIRFGFLAYTQFVNLKGTWRGYIDLYDSAKARQDVASLKRQVDVVVVSFHGGAEYGDHPTAQTRAQLRSLADVGADVVLGHHSHVPQGIEERNGALVFCSLGNAVFFQPQHDWTQRSFAPVMTFDRDTSGQVSLRASLLTLRTGYRPRVAGDSVSVWTMWKRLSTLSPVPLVIRDSAMVIDHSFNIKRNYE